MDQERTPASYKLAIIGNSNSVMRESYARKLEQLPYLHVINKSIGSSPNVVLLDFLALEQDWDYDFIIVETAVVDFLQANGSYTAERSAETLELFIRCVRSRSRAEIILLSIPTRLALLAPGSSWQETVYQDAADTFRLPIINGFRLIRALIGRQKAAGAGLLASRASRLAQAFDIDAGCAPFMAWREIRDQRSQANALGLLSFIDHAHFSPSLHALIASLVAEHIHRSGRIERQHSALADPPDLPVVAVMPRGVTPLFRTSSLISRQMMKLIPGEQAVFHCPPGFRAHGLLVNKASTCCFLRFQSSVGSAVFDLRFQPQKSPWTAVVVAILDPIGDTDVVVSALERPDASDQIRKVPNTSDAYQASAAEVGELILVRSDWRDRLPDDRANAPPAFNIETAAWAQALIASAALAVSQVIDGLTAENQVIDKRSFDAAAKLLGDQTAPLSAAAQARLMLLLGMSGTLANFVGNACRDNPDDGSLLRMQAALRQLAAEDGVSPEDLLNQARALVRSGLLPKADRALADGVARFPSDIRFLIERAWISYRQKDWTEATSRWRNVIDSFPNHHVGYLGLARCLSESGDTRAGNRLLESTIVRFPDNAEVARHRTLIHAEENASGSG